MQTIVNKAIRIGRVTMLAIGLAVTVALVMGLASTALAGTSVGARFDLGKVNVIKNATTALQGSGSSSGSGALFEVKHDGSSFAPALRAENTGLGTGVQIKVQPGRIPISVNPDAATALGLSADKLDGKDSSSFASGTNGKAKDASRADFATTAGEAQNAQVADDANNLDGKDSTAFVPTKTYQVIEQRTGAGGGSLEQRSPQCGQGDVVLNGGFSVGGFNLDSGVVVVEDHAAPVNSTWLVRVVDVGSPSFIAGFATCGDLPPLR